MAVESPCNQVCQIDPASGYCRGCLRTIEEIIDWPTADDAWKRGVLDRLKRRSVRRG
ncbi:MULTISPECIES: DUF1289 domain-containing protein [unclassified Sphingomonas]|uniref:DUF1289 domain-containing protein n=1 Tax=unclassified Sphingomonas TaxID=196159 RepID=UPI0009E6F64F|nr:MULTISPECIES: DUF1289 domain-containing protein [unclassified Sphingomonas]